ncbi:MAG: hypothetical protein H0T50_10725, partial [Gemmatimonadales bacterium]|nr:hypothetical protein [Gemmatimonadales bacterium]
MLTSPLLELRLFGAPAVRIRTGCDAAAVLAQPKRVALFAYLAAATPHGFHRRDTLLALLLGSCTTAAPGSPPAAAAPGPASSGPAERLTRDTPRATT